MNKKLVINNEVLMLEWNWEKNKKYNPSLLTYGSTKKIWWKCSKGHEWETTISNRNRGDGCPFCSNKKILKGYNDLQTINPKLSLEWNYELNNGITPDVVGVGTAKKFWWKCSKGHSWEESIRSRNLRETGCPYCSGHRVKQGFNDLKTTNPELIKEWDYKKNKNIHPTNVSRGSAKKVWWRCEYGHQWNAAIHHRANGENCPICNNSKQTSFPEQAIYYYLRKVFKNVISRYKGIFKNGMEIDLYIPEIKTGIEYDGKYYHNNNKSLKREIEKYNICKKNNIKLIRVRERAIEKEKNCDYAIECNWNSLNYNELDKTINEVTKKLNKYIEVDSERDRIEIIGLYKSNLKEKSLKIKNPTLSSEWNYEKNGTLKPEMFTISSGIKVWWKCKKGHEWEESITKRTNGNNCPYCSGHRVLKGFNDLTKIKSNLVSEWNYEKNGTLKPEMFTAFSGKKVWWKCSKGHEWEAVISKRANGNNCPYCTNKKIINGYNDLCTLNSNLSSEWNYEKNGSLTPKMVTSSSGKKVWWKCKQGHEWETTISNRKKGCGCPYCANKRILQGYNDFATLHPNLLKEWDYDRNENLSPKEVGVGSTKKVWWKCSKGHNWETSVSNRVKGNNCPYCCNQKILEGYNDLYTLNHNIALEWDYDRNENLSPKEVGVGSARKVWWKCRAGHVWKCEIRNRCKGSKCPICKNQKKDYSFK